MASQARTTDGQPASCSGDEGASAVEYGLLVFAIAATVVLVVFALGGVVQNLFSGTCTKVATAATGSTC